MSTTPSPQSPNSHFQLTIRSRPLLPGLEDEEAWSIDPQSSTVSSIYRPPNQFLQDPSSIENVNYIKRRYADVNYNYIFKFDGVFDHKNTTEDVYKYRCRDVVYSFMSGVSGTIFTYGQTMSGKTFTMLGAVNNPGILPFALLDIFDDIEKKRKENYQIKTTLSYFEIYNETLKDLLNPDTAKLKILDDPKNGVLIHGLKYCEVRSFEEAIMVLKIGEEERKYAQTTFHDRSSRSHTIFQVKLEMTTNKDKTIHSVLNLIDLAGSERVGEDDVKHNQSEETGFINKSLFVLSNVIHRLAEGKKNAYIPYRDSKLTRILAHSLGGNTPTAIICTISPANINFYQTLSTLRFADRAKSVQRNVLFTIDPKILNNNINKSTTKPIDNSNYDQIIDDLRKQLDLKDKEIKNLKVSSSLRKEAPDSIKKLTKSPQITLNSSLEINEEFIQNLKTMNIPINKISDFFEEIDLASKMVLNSKEHTINCNNIKDWCLKYQDFYNNYKKIQLNCFENLKNIPYEKTIDIDEKVLELLENETLFQRPKDCPQQSSLDFKRRLDEDYERYWGILENYFKKLISNVKGKEFVNLHQITENHKKSLIKLDWLYKRALGENKEKTPKFSSEDDKLPYFNFSNVKK